MQENDVSAFNKSQTPFTFRNGAKLSTDEMNPRHFPSDS